MLPFLLMSDVNVNLDLFINILKITKYTQSAKKYTGKFYKLYLKCHVNFICKIPLFRQNHEAQNIILPKITLLETPPAGHL